MTDPTAYTLVLLRHAKSSWVDASQADHDRPLNCRGRLAASLMGAWLTETQRAPDAALCSTAARAQQTLERLAPLLPQAPDIYTDRSLYMAAPGAMLARLREVPSTAHTVLMIGHNPGIEAFAAALASDNSPPPPSRIATAAAVVLTASRPWREWSGGGARVVDAAAPKALV